MPQEKVVEKNDLISLFFIFGVWLFIFLKSGIFNGGFNYFLDDHQILLCQDKCHSFGYIYIEPFSHPLEPNRFRPLYWVMLRCFSGLYGLNPFTWYLSSFLIAVVTTCIFYFVARQNFWSKIEALLFALLTILGHQASTYDRFGTPETTAMLFTALAFLCASVSGRSKIWQLAIDVLLIVFSTLAALNKEACILMLPALAVYKVWIAAKKNELTFRQAVRSNFLIVAALLIIFGMCIGYIKVMGIAGPGYAGISLSTFAWFSYVKLFAHLVLNTSFALAVLINIWFIKEKWNRGQWRNFTFIGYYFVLACVVLPQIVLYSTSGMNDHYLFPAVIGIAFSTIYPLVGLKGKYPAYFKIGLIIVALIIAQHCFSTFRHFKDVANITGEMKALTDDLSRWAGSDRRVLVCGNPLFNNEALWGFRIAMEKMIKNHQTFLATYGSRNDMVATDCFKQDEAFWAFLDEGTVESWYGKNLFRKMSQKSRKDIQIIVLFSKDRLSETFLKTSAGWFNPKMFTYKDYNWLNIRVYHSVNL